MAIVLGPNQYGKAECRVVRVYRDGARHHIRDLNVSSALRGDFTDAHIGGDQADVLPTDTQKNTAFAFAKEKGVGELENFALTLGDHFVEQTTAVREAKIEVEEYGWQRIDAAGEGHDHSFVRTGQEARTTAVTVRGSGPDRHAWVVSGIKDLLIAKTTGSEFNGFLRDRYTTLADTNDRVLATSLIARWRYEHTSVDWDKSFSSIRAILLETFAQVHSKALQQTLYEMGKAVLEQVDEVAEVAFSAPNKHHFLVDLEQFGVANDGEVFFAADRPYGLIEATVRRDEAPDAGPAWDSVPGFC